MHNYEESKRYKVATNNAASHFIVIKFEGKEILKLDANCPSDRHVIETLEIFTEIYTPSEGYTVEIIEAPKTAKKGKKKDESPDMQSA